MKSILGILTTLLIVGFTVTSPLKTKLRVTILDGLGNIQDSVAVTLYANADDYRASVNPVVPMQLTDAKGRTTFAGLEPKEYYIHAQKGDKTNVGAGVVADVLKEGKLNKITIIIE